jgi:putative transposase
MSYLKIAPSVYDLKYQLVWITKYHKAILYRAISLLVRNLMEKIRASPDSYIAKGHVSKDHLHFLASITQNLPLSELATRLKG